MHRQDPDRGNARTAEPFVERHLDASDPRADGRRREVHIARDRIVIARRVDGVAMRIALPPSAYDGVLLGIAASAGEGLLYEVRLQHRDPDLCVLLMQGGDADEARREWRAWTRDLSLPAMVERDEGGPGVELTPLGGVVMGEAQPRRRGSAMTRRRPRFLTRRRPGRRERMEIVEPCQREIFPGSSPER